MNKSVDEWKVLKGWPKRLSSAVNMPEGQIDFCQKLFLENRLRFELNCISKEIRVCCTAGAEVFPVDDNTWGAIVSGGYWTRKMLNLLGGDARHPAGGVITGNEVGNKYDETQIQFPTTRLNEVLKLLHPKTRPLRNQHGNPDSLSARGKPRFVAA